jgi:hypothetical protein
MGSWEIREETQTFLKKRERIYFGDVTIIIIKITKL